MKRVYWNYLPLALAILCVSPITFAGMVGPLPNLQVAASGDAESAPFDVAKDQWIKVALSNTAPRPVIYIYNVADAAHKDLMSMSDPEADEDETFKWTAPDTSRYSVEIHNPGLKAAIATITIMPPGAKGVVAGQLAKAGEVNVFYATNRKRLNTDSSNVKYGDDLNANLELEYGSAIVTIPRDHRMGEMEGSVLYRLHFGSDGSKLVMQDAKLMSASEFFPALFVAHKDVLVFVHGYNVSFVDGVRRAAQIQYDLGLKTNCVVFSWPSQEAIPNPISYAKAEESAKLSAAGLQHFLEQLEAQKGVGSIHLIAHSMGNRLAVQALKNMKPGLTRIRYVALMAPDIDAKSFQAMAKSMKASADNITLYASSGDLALKASKTLSGFTRAGEGGKNVLVMPDVFETVDASYVETSELGMLHSYYADNSTILADVFHFMRGDAADDRFGLQKVSTAKGDYWNFKPSAR